MEHVATFFGYSITVGVIVSLVTQLLKIWPSFTLFFEGDDKKIRTFVILVCAALNVTDNLLTGGIVCPTIIGCFWTIADAVIASAISYSASVTTYDHVFKR